MTLTTVATIVAKPKNSDGIKNNNLAGHSVQELAELYKIESFHARAKQIEKILNKLELAKDSTSKETLKDQIAKLASGFDVDSVTNQLLITKIEQQLEQLLKEQNYYKHSDSFEAAFDIALKNDGKIDAKELSLLKKIRQREQSNPLVIQVSSNNLTIDSYSPTKFEININGSLNISGSIQSKQHNQVLRDAFDIAALDGEINTTEANSLKTLID